MAVLAAAPNIKANRHTDKQTNKKCSSAAENVVVIKQRRTLDILISCILQILAPVSAVLPAAANSSMISNDISNRQTSKSATPTVAGVESRHPSGLWKAQSSAAADQSIG